MALSQIKTEKISILVVQVLYSRFTNFPEDASQNRNAPFHTAFLNAFSDKFADKACDIPFFVSLSGWLHGLNTTIGQTFFENAAFILSDGEKREYTSGKLGNLKITVKQRETIGKIAANLSNKTIKPNLIEENKLLFINDDSELISAMDFSADLFINDGENITAIELKTVRPNSGSSQGEKQKILEGKTALFNKFPNHQISFFVVFPFDPTNRDSATGFDKDRFIKHVINLNKSFAPEEILLAGELWDKLSGEENTMESILTIINSIATPEFMNEYSFLNDQQNKINSPEKYGEILMRWNLFSELELFDKNPELMRKISGSKNLMKILNQLIFKDGKYKHDRYENLKTHLVEDDA
jgi:hypothetical protein